MSLTQRQTIAGLYPLAIVPQGDPIRDVVLSTGWWELDEIFKLYPGQFVVTTGLAGHGKSTFLFNVLLNIARLHDIKSWMYVPENENFIREKLRSIYGSRDGDVDFGTIAMDNLFVQCSGYEHYNDDPHTIDWVLDAAANAIDIKGVSVVMIDPWNELEWAKRRDENLTDYIRECLRKVKLFAKCTGCTVFMIAHPTKAAIDRGSTPTLADIEGSMHWYNKCDNGLIIVREDGRTKVISAKSRERGAGKIGVCLFKMDANEQFTPEYGAVTC